MCVCAPAVPVVVEREAFVEREPVIPLRGIPKFWSPDYAAKFDKRVRAEGPSPTLPSLPSPNTRPALALPVSEGEQLPGRARARVCVCVCVCCVCDDHVIVCVCVYVPRQNPLSSPTSKLPLLSPVTLHRTTSS